MHHLLTPTDIRFIALERLRQLTAAHAPFWHVCKLRLHFAVFEKFDVGLVQRGPMAVSCTQAHGRQLTRIMAATGEESQVVQLPRIDWDLDNARVWRHVSEEHLSNHSSIFKLIQYFNPER
jgi:hypothetical protein